MSFSTNTWELIQKNASNASKQMLFFGNGKKQNPKGLQYVNSLIDSMKHPSSCFDNIIYT